MPLRWDLDFEIALLGDLFHFSVASFPKVGFNYRVECLLYDALLKSPKRLAQAGIAEREDAYEFDKGNPVVFHRDGSSGNDSVECGRNLALQGRHCLLERIRILTFYLNAVKVTLHCYIVDRRGECLASLAVENDDLTFLLPLGGKPFEVALRDVMMSSSAHPNRPRRPASVSRTRATSIVRPAATTRSAFAVASPARTSL
jgi:hypothetical protein